LSKEVARRNLGLSQDEKIILFFGFIRQYKGLDILLHAMADERIKKAGIKLMIAGEFYEEAAMYHRLIAELGIGSQLILKTDFIPDAAVRNFLCAADAVIQPYRHATQSGVTPLAYHFEKPMIVTDVGSFSEHVLHEKTGLVVPPEPAALAEAILRFYELGEEFFIPHLREEKKKYSWKNLVNAILGLAHDIQK